MKLQCLSNHFKVKRITEESCLEVLQLCEGNPMYYQYCPPKPTKISICEDLKKLPPKKTLKDKFYIGFYEEEKLVAVMDLILAYPNEETIFIGFFMVEKAFQKKGIGSFIIKEVLSYLSQEYTFVRLGYVQNNQQSESFWLKNHFHPTGVVVKEENYSIVVLERKLEE
ncbi:MAG: GNAT family N-acetyltransferase [Anaeroplasmataceae bacterium]|nr:GNAT family N-acetyltransferase [Anaeroplasmataceae bacterium]